MHQSVFCRVLNSTSMKRQIILTDNDILSTPKVKKIKIIRISPTMMEVIETPRHINDLPYNVFVKIFKTLDVQLEEYKKYRCVCTVWCKYITLMHKSEFYIHVPDNITLDEYLLYLNNILYFAPPPSIRLPTYKALSTVQLPELLQNSIFYLRISYESYEVKIIVSTLKNLKVLALELRADTEFIYKFILDEHRLKVRSLFVSSEYNFDSKHVQALFPYTTSIEISLSATNLINRLNFILYDHLFNIVSIAIKVPPEFNDPTINYNLLKLCNSFELENVVLAKICVQVIGITSFELYTSLVKVLHKRFFQLDVCMDETFCTNLHSVESMTNYGTTINSMQEYFKNLKSVVLGSGEACVELHSNVQPMRTVKYLKIYNELMCRQCYRNIPIMFPNIKTLAFMYTRKAIHFKHLVLFRQLETLVVFWKCGNISHVLSLIRNNVCRSLKKLQIIIPKNYDFVRFLQDPRYIELKRFYPKLVVVKSTFAKKTYKENFDSIDCKENTF